MKVLCLVSMLAVASAFTPVPHAARSNLFTKTSLLAKKAAAPAMANPFNSLPWNVKKEKEREARRLKSESAQLHRELGIAEDSTFEEIQEVTNKLIMKADSEGDVKRKIKVEVAKDRIMQIKLNERLAGNAILTEDAKAQSRLEEAE